MADFFFVVKTFLLTIALVVVMQIRVGEYTIEDRAQAWIHESEIHHTLGRVAVGAVAVMKDGVDYVQTWIAGNGDLKSASTAER